MESVRLTRAIGSAALYDVHAEIDVEVVLLGPINYVEIKFP